MSPSRNPRRDDYAAWRQLHDAADAALEGPLYQAIREHLEAASTLTTGFLDNPDLQDATRPASQVWFALGVRHGIKRGIMALLAIRQRAAKELERLSQGVESAS